MFKYRTSFENFVTASLNFDNNVLVSKASLESLKSLIPSSVNLDANVDLIGAAFNAALVNKFNKNGDGIDTNTAIAFKSILFINQQTLNTKSKESLDILLIQRFQLLVLTISFQMMKLKES